MDVCAIYLYPDTLLMMCQDLMQNNSVLGMNSLQLNLLQLLMYYVYYYYYQALLKKLSIVTTEVLEVKNKVSGCQAQIRRFWDSQNCDKHHIRDPRPVANFKLLFHCAQHFSRQIFLFGKSFEGTFFSVTFALAGNYL